LINRQALTWLQYIRIAKGLANGLSVVHSEGDVLFASFMNFRPLNTFSIGIIHRDIKPANILMGDDGNIFIVMELL
jgi:serine/threonine protein kinase